MSQTHPPLADMQAVAAFLKEHGLYLVTAESCTAGLIASLLADVEGSGQVLDRGYAVYSPQAKHHCLGVSYETIERFGLTSEEVSREMALGALRNSKANIALANTGIAGPSKEEGMPPSGTLCFACALEVDGEPRVFSETRRFAGDRAEVRKAAAEYVLRRLNHYYARLCGG